MSFINAIFLLALAMVANGSVVPLGWGGAVNAWGDGTWGGPAAWGGHSAWDGHGAWGGPGVWGAGAWGDGAWGHGAWGHGPAAVVAHAAVPAVIASHAAPIGHSGSYVAANRGSVHVAPLAGHIQSVKSLNVAPAPGTW